MACFYTEGDKKKELSISPGEFLRKEATFPRLPKLLEMIYTKRSKVGNLVLDEVGSFSVHVVLQDPMR